MGAVYKAQHLLMQRTVALKVLSENLTGNDDAIRRFHREVQAVARLNHRSIVTAYDAEQVGGSHFLVMEYVPGKSLARVVAEQGPLPVSTACEWICQAADGLQHAHLNGHVHRDIKPQNLMSTPDGQLKILDFGLARFATESLAAETGGDAAPHANAKSGHGVSAGLTRAGSVMGTPDYIAPEQATDPRKADIRADIYSLGCTLYFLLTGKTPFAGDTVIEKLIAHQEQEPRPISECRSDVPPGVVRAVGRMMSKKPEARYATPNDVVRALEPWRIPTAETLDHADQVLPTSAPTAAPTAPLPTSVPATAPKRRGRVFLTCAGLLLISFLGCAGLLTWLVHYTTDKVKELSGLFQDRTTKDELWKIVESSWTPPPDTARIEDFFPPAILDYSRESIEDRNAIEELELMAAGSAAMYRLRDKRVEIFIAKVEMDQKDKLFETAREAVNSKEKVIRMTTVSGTATSKRLIYVSGPWKGVMWWNNGWLFVAHSTDDDNPERLLLSLLRSSVPDTPSKTKPRGESKKRK